MIRINRSMKLFALHIVWLLALCLPAKAQDLTDTNCGVNSALSLSRVLGSETDARSVLQAAYPAATVSLLDVKRMCAQQNIPVQGVKATLDELLQAGTPSIIGLQGPEHFTLLLDGNADEVRLLEGEVGALQIVPRSEIEARFTGYALMPQIAAPADAPQLQMPRYDQYLTFGGIGQKVDFRFPLANSGQTPLTIEIAGTSCGCTAAVLAGADAKKLILAPAAHSEVVVSYSVQSQAPVQQMATLRTNDPRHPVVYLSIRGQLPPQLTLSPPALYVAQAQGEEPNKSFKVIGPKGMAIASVSSDLPFLSFEIGPQEADGERVKWPVSVRGFARAPGGALGGALGGKINVRLTDGKEVFVAVRGQIEGLLPGAAQAALLPRAEANPHAPIGSPLPTVQVGQAAPDFTATDADGKTWKLSQLKGTNVLLTFFPKCFTGGCANHLSSRRDHQREFDAAHTQILAVSVDPAQGDKGQRAFAAQWGFAFPLIPDTSRALSRQFGALQNDDELAARMSVLIDKAGVVRWIDTDVRVQTHGSDALAKIRELRLNARG